MTQGDLRAIDADEPPGIGVLSETLSPTLVEVYGEIGLDFVWFDLEHLGFSPYDSGKLENLVRAAEVANISLIVRLPALETAMVRRVLDTGVRNLIFPRIETPTEVRRMVEAAYLSFEGQPGERGLAGSRSNSWGNRMADQLKHADEEITVGIMCETEEAVDNLEQLLAVPELGFVFVGTWDLSHSLGCPLEEENPAVREAIRTIESSCRHHGIPLMGFVDNPENAHAKVDQGYSLLVIESELGLIRQATNEWLSKFDASMAE